MRKVSLILIFLFCFHAITNAQIGIYDIQGISGVNFTKPKKLEATSEIGTDYDLGITFLNIPYDKSYAFGAEAHFDYSRQNFDLMIGKLHFRRKEIYTRIRPLSLNVYAQSELISFLQLFLTGLYADIGYTQGNYFYEDYLGNMDNNIHKQNGLFWGYGYNYIFRDNKVSVIVGYGSKQYAWTGANDKRISYSSRSFHLGMF